MASGDLNMFACVVSTLEIIFFKSKCLPENFGDLSKRVFECLCPLQLFANTDQQFAELNYLPTKISSKGIFHSLVSSLFL